MAVARGRQALRLWVVLYPRCREPTDKGSRRLLRRSCGGGARGRRWVVRKERNLYGPSIVHDGGVPHGRSEDTLVRALVLLRPPGVALADHARCELDDLSQRACCAQK
jgi:hypothetical protein